MRLPSFLPDRASIATRLIGWFLVISFIPCALVLAITMAFSRRSLEVSVRDRLVAICDAKASQLEAYIAERRGDATSLSTAPGFVEATVRLGQFLKEGRRDSDAFRAAAETYRARLVSYTEAGSYTGMALLDLDGVPLVSQTLGVDIGPGLESGPLRDSELADSFRRAKAQLQPVVTNFQAYPGQKGGLGFVVGPIFREGVVIGAVVLGLSNAEVFRSFNTYSGLGATGDVTAAMEDSEGSSGSRRPDSTSGPPSATGSSSAPGPASTCSSLSGGIAAMTRCWTTPASPSSRPGPISRPIAGGSR